MFITSVKKRQINLLKSNKENLIIKICNPIICILKPLSIRRRNNIQLLPMRIAISQSNKISMMTCINQKRKLRLHKTQILTKKKSQDQNQTMMKMNVITLPITQNFKSCRKNLETGLLVLVIKCQQMSALVKMILLMRKLSGVLLNLQ